MFASAEEEKLFRAPIPRRSSTGGLCNGGQVGNSQLCIRCGSKEHFWRQCPRQFRKELLFGAKPSGDMKGKGKSTLLLTEEGGMEEE